ncbi:major facilitator superfamily domain-containing protein [Immersiella caudata]|uniref:Major facilitator superfamily domain-containing protein n=1 Tax=Immersiella caudata TaxID=314043 RepID=A0AA39XER1_9PEZI|nr:major facilitator superfamily domain-containing protein [Immersiella caudata]
MPLLIMGFFVLQLDRGNIGNALTDFFLQDVGITQNQFNVGQQLLSLGIVLLEIPSNLILYRTGPTVWIGCQILAWGLVATFQAFQKGLASFLITRLLLGFCESGFIPAGLFTITRWYKRDETSKRFSWFFIGNMSAGACSGLIAYGILHMRGVCGLAGWQWLFLLEGILTILAGLIFLTLFPSSPSSPISLLHRRYFTPRESLILHRRVILDDPTKGEPRRHVSLSELKHTLSNWRLLPHILLTICGLAPSALFMAYAPSLVVSFGFDRLRANAMTSIGAWILLVTNIAWGMISDRIGKRGPMVTLGLLLFWGATLGNRLLIESKNPNLRFAFITLGIVFSSNWHPVNGSWMALNTDTSGERSITMAVLIMSANTSGIVGSQIFQQEDRPLYRTGWTIIIALATFALIMSVVANVQYRVLNRRGKTKQDGAKFSL